MQTESGMVLDNLYKVVDVKNWGDEQTNERYTVISVCVEHFRKHR